MFHRMCHTALSFRTFSFVIQNILCHSERSEDGLLSEAKNLEYIKWVSPRSFVATLLWMTMGERGAPLDDNPTRRFPMS